MPTCKCAICWEEIDTDALYLYCSREGNSELISHTFHSACLQRHAEEQWGRLKCPLCNTPVVEAGAARTVAAGEGARWVVARRVRQVRQDGSVLFFEGDEGEERLVRAHFPDGRVEHYNG